MWSKKKKRKKSERQKVNGEFSFPFLPWLLQSHVGLISCSLCPTVVDFFFFFFPLVCDATESCAALTGGLPCCRRDNGGEAERAAELEPLPHSRLLN